MPHPTKFANLLLSPSLSSLYIHNPSFTKSLYLPCPSPSLNLSNSYFSTCIFQTVNPPFYLHLPKALHYIYVSEVFVFAVISLPASPQPSFTRLPLPPFHLTKHHHHITASPTRPRPLKPLNEKVDKAPPFPQIQ